MTVKIISDVPVFSRQTICPRCCLRLEYTGVDVTFVDRRYAEGRSYTLITCPNDKCEREIEVPPWQYASPPRPEEEASKKPDEA